MKIFLALFLLPSAIRQTLAYSVLSNSSLTKIAPPDDDFDVQHGPLLAPILRTRVPGTEGSKAVLSHFVNFFSTLPEWKLTFQNSSSVTPTSGGKKVPFHNLIATRDPPWLKDRQGDVGRLALVAHYDSKLTPKGFIGATDSAVPCAILLHAARTLDEALTRRWAAMEADGSANHLDAEPQGVQLIFLDGEEAFATWTHTDSIYGARALAEEWETTIHPAMSTFRNPLCSISLFVLLDLLGAVDPVVPSYFKTTHWAYAQMASVETRLRALKRLKSSPKAPFLPEAGKTNDDAWMGGFIEDDHLPFLARGVDILHIIPSPFPRVWHTIDDDAKHLDLDVSNDWAVITTAFAAEWLDLDGFIEAKNPTKRSSEKTEL
ncbi:glutaminyl-peptide cyclotransferase [Piedraia hortae CBS 480.64]|uniref:Peptide hydrolase n=1 Tax=Piedraia hortae CBS 480.64 TaxID=1314780 RepID=A0A6A7C8I1_9PEZI|nr:glutaminyl-peptide cyclotransferase [Piedraia hortae CBS 480.64]